MIASSMGSIKESIRERVSVRQLAAPDGRLRIAGTVNDSIVDGEGYRYTIFTQGCPHGCPGCHNPQTHAFQGGYEASPDRLLREALANPLLEGVTFSGGEPFCQAAVLADMAAEFHRNGLNVWCYSGYTYEQLSGCRQQSVRHLLQQLDVLVDGPYMEERRDLTLRFRGSGNQRLIDVPASLQRGSAVLYQIEE